MSRGTPVNTTCPRSKADINNPKDQCYYYNATLDGEKVPLRSILIAQVSMLVSFYLCVAQVEGGGIAIAYSSYIVAVLGHYAQFVTKGKVSKKVAIGILIWNVVFLFVPIQLFTGAFTVKEISGLYWLISVGKGLPKGNFVVTSVFWAFLGIPTTVASFAHMILLGFEKLYQSKPHELKMTA